MSIKILIVGNRSNEYIILLKNIYKEYEFITHNLYIYDNYSNYIDELSPNIIIYIYTDYKSSETIMYENYYDIVNCKYPLYKINGDDDHNDVYTTILEILNIL